ncbi:MFS transporter [Alicyclobacillus sp. SO9]|uniref:MFS transporter n=1 Tax=Alicyclobacillus sp. SO9 TaxID=2665646 RepID=UPI0018E6EC7B|nr:MFS transporter [Alicyclobacillus sp. SO9]QQE78075.1 MFS transporter [Alicyclobacillus sp. SO9]
MMIKHQEGHASNWRVLLILFFLTSIVESMGMSHVFSFMPVYLQGMHTPHVATWVGILSAVTFVTGLPLVPLWGIWAQRFGGKAIIIRSAYVETVVFVVLGMSHVLAGVFIGMLLVGFQLGNTGVMLAEIRRAAPNERVGYAVSVFSVASSVGMAGGPLLGGLLTGIHLINLHGLYILDGILSFLVGTMLLVWYRQPRQQPHEQSGRRKQSPAKLQVSQAEDDGVTSGSAAQQSAWKAAWKSVQFTFSLRISWVLFGIYTVLMMARQMVMPYLPIVIENLHLHFASTTFIIGILMGLTAVIGAVITVIAGRIGDRLGFVRILAIAFAAAIPASVLLGFLGNVLWFTVALTVFSAGYSIGGAMIFALFSTRIPESHRSTALNLVYLPLYLGGIIGPTLASALTHVGLFGPYIGAAVFLLSGLVLILTLLVKRRSSTPVPHSPQSPSM